MNAEVGRRVFVGSVVAGLPFLAALPALAQRGATAGHTHAADRADPVLDLLVRQMARTHNAAAQTTPRAEHFRALAAQLRTLALYERQLGVDEQIRAAVKELVDRDGRNAVLYATPDVEMRRRNLQTYGFRLPVRGREPAVFPSHQQREDVLDDLLERGITPAFDQMAAVADRVALRIDASRARGLVFQQSDQEWWQAYCAEVWAQYEQAQQIANPVCIVAKYWPGFVPSCIALEGGAAVLLLAYLFDCPIYA